MNACLAYRFQNRIPREKSAQEMHMILEFDNFFDETNPVMCLKNASA